ncbi:MAG: porin [Burkholderiales bacterium]|nr:porin [Burkholderiales bacterium]
MKKSLVALAALAVAGVASAQSSVTLSGTLDAGLEKISGGALQLQNSRNGTTQITVSGVEDLGGGLKARFQISSSFDSTFDNGQIQGNRAGTTTAGTQAQYSPSKFGNNGMFLALDGGFGSLILGRPLNTLYSHSYTANGTKGVTGFAATNTIDAQSIYTSNAIQYVTPNLAGFTAQFEYAPSEATDVKSTTSIGLKYASGPFGVSLVRDNAKGTVVGGDYSAKTTQLAGFWDFGVAKLSATYQDSSTLPSDSDQAYVFGLNVPVGPGQFWIQYGNRELAGTDARIVGLGYKYSLSKRTTAYVNLGSRNDAAAGTAGNSGWGLGLQHNF